MNLTASCRAFSPFLPPPFSFPPFRCRRFAGKARSGRGQKRPPPTPPQRSHQWHREIEFLFSPPPLPLPPFFLHWRTDVMRKKCYPPLLLSRRESSGLHLFFLFSFLLSLAAHTLPDEVEDVERFLFFFPPCAPSSTGDNDQAISIVGQAHFPSSFPSFFPFPGRLQRGVDARFFPFFVPARLKKAGFMVEQNLQHFLFPLPFLSRLYRVRSRG